MQDHKHLVLDASKVWLYTTEWYLPDWWFKILIISNLLVRAVRLNYFPVAFKVEITSLWWWKGLLFTILLCGFVKIVARVLWSAVCFKPSFVSLFISVCGVNHNQLLSHQNCSHSAVAFWPLKDLHTIILFYRIQY